MNAYLFSLLLCLGLSSAVFAECKITLTCNPSLPATNLVVNPGFEEGGTYGLAATVTYANGNNGYISALAFGMGWGTWGRMR